VSKILQPNNEQDGRQGTHSACSAVREAMLLGKLPTKLLPAAFLRGRQGRKAP
jgi:hypothetical protein